AKFLRGVRILLTPSSASPYHCELTSSASAGIFKIFRKTGCLRVGITRVLSCIRSNRMRSLGKVQPWFVVVFASLVTFSGRAHADDADMSFDFEDVEATVADLTPPEKGEPTADLRAALQLYSASRFPEAAMALQRVVDGETGDDAGNIQLAQFTLAKTMYSMRFYQSALALFDEITIAATGHHHFDESLQWLAQLATQLPEPAGITERIGRYPLARIETFNTPENQQLYNHL